MSNGSAVPPQHAIRRMISTFVDTIQSLFSDLWVDAYTNDPQESTSSGNTEAHIPNSSWNHVVQPYTGVSLKQSTQTISSRPCTITKDDTVPENPHRAISSLISTAATNQLLFPELWNPADKVEQDISTDRFQVAYGSPSIWTQQQDIRLPINKKKTPKPLARLESLDRTKDEDSSDSGFYSGTYSA